MVWVGNKAGRDLRSRPASPAQPVSQAPHHAASTLPPPLLPWEVFYPNLLLGYFFFPLSVPPDLFLLVRFPWPWGTGYFFPLTNSCAYMYPHFPPRASQPPKLMLPMALVVPSHCPPDQVLGSPLWVAALLLSPPSLSPALSPGQLGVVAVPIPALGCLISPLSAHCRLFLEQWGCGPCGEGSQEPGRQELAFPWGPLPVPGGPKDVALGAWCPSIPLLALSTLSLPQFPCWKHAGGTLPDSCHVLPTLCRFRTSPGSLSGTKMFIARGKHSPCKPGKGIHGKDRAGGAAAWRWVGGGSAWAGAEVCV